MSNINTDFVLKEVLEKFPNFKDIKFKNIDIVEDELYYSVSYNIDIIERLIKIQKITKSEKLYRIVLFVVYCKISNNSFEERLKHTKEYVLKKDEHEA